MWLLGILPMLIYSVRIIARRRGIPRTSILLSPQIGDPAMLLTLSRPHHRSRRRAFSWSAIENRLLRVYPSFLEVSFD